MSTTMGRADAGRRSWARGWGTLARVLAWPVRAYRARQVMHQFAALGENELRDIGLTRQDLVDASALSIDADPSLQLHRRAEDRRSRR